MAEDDVVTAFQSFCAKDNELTTKDNGKLVKACWGAGMSTSGDIIFSRVKPKGSTKIPVNKTTVDTYLSAMAIEWMKIKKCDTIEQARADLESKLKAAVPKKKDEPKFSKSGAVDRLTDTTKYTGSHRERFDETGKGKGASGRQDKAENTGYTGQYKNAGTYDKKK